MLGWFLLYRKWLSYTHIYILFFNIFFSILVYHRLLNTALHAIEKDLVVYPYHTQYLTIPLCSPPGNKSVFYSSKSVAVSQTGSHLCHFLFLAWLWDTCSPTGVKRRPSTVKTQESLPLDPQGIPRVIFQIPYRSYKVVVSLFLI